MLLGAHTERLIREVDLLHLGKAVFVLTYILICMGENSPLQKSPRPPHGSAPWSGSDGADAAPLRAPRPPPPLILARSRFLFGMMVLAGRSGPKQTSCGVGIARSQTLPDPARLLGGVVFISGIASALMLNDTVCRLGTPILLDVVTQAELPAVPFLLALATGSNIGSVMTLTGDPQNMIIGHLSGWNWSGFAMSMAPIGLICLAVDSGSSFS